MVTLLDHHLTRLLDTQVILLLTLLLFPLSGAAIRAARLLGVLHPPGFYTLLVFIPVYILYSLLLSGLALALSTFRSTLNAFRYRGFYVLHHLSTITCVGPADASGVVLTSCSGICALLSVLIF